MNNNPIPNRRKVTTADDFLNWLNVRKAAGKLAEEKAARHSAMRWADDGGRTVEQPLNPNPTPAGD